MNCLSKDNIKMTQVILSLNDLKNVQASFHTTQMNFAIMRDGLYVMHKKLSKSEYIVISKENITVCYFDAVRISET